MQCVVEMFKRILCRSVKDISKNKNNMHLGPNEVSKRLLTTTAVLYSKPDISKELVLVTNFEKIEKKNKKMYLEMVKIFEGRGSHRRGHVEFINSALKNMKEFGVHKDLEVYKALVDVLPKGRFIPTNIFQAEFMHYPKQQQCIIELLEQMEDNGVIPDEEMEHMLLNIFGRRGFPLRKFWRMMYWMPKFKNLTPWPVPDPLPNDVLGLAKLAVERISSVDNLSKITVYQARDIPDCIEDTWIVSAQSPEQRKLLNNHDKKCPVYVEGSFKVWIKDQCVNYFILRGDSKPPKKDIEELDDVSKLEVPLFNISSPEENKLGLIPSVHEQETGVIYSVCATGTSGRDSLLSWIRHLEKDGNPSLASIPVIFTLKSPGKDLAVVNSDLQKKDSK